MGFLNPTDDDDYRISQMAGTTEVPAVGAFQGLLTAVPKNLVSAGEKVGDMLATVGGAVDPVGTDEARVADNHSTGVYGEPLPFYPGNAAPSIGTPPGQSDFLSQASIKQSFAAAQIVSDWAATGQDPRQTGVVGRIVGGTAEGVAIGAAGAAVAGPWGAAALLGSTEGHSTYLEAKQNGVDDKTAMEQAAIAGGFSAASAFLPMKVGKTLAQSLVGGAAMNVGFGAAQRLATSTVLKANGYDDMASQYRVFDGEAMASDAILGAAFGGMGHAMGEHINPADVDAASAVVTEDHYNRSAPGVPTDPEVANLHNETMADSLTRMANGDLPDIQPDVAQKIVEGVLPDPIHEVDQPLQEAAHEELPGYAEAAADVPRVELSPEEVPPARVEPEPAPAADGQPAKIPDVPLDDYHQSVLDHLVHNSPDEKFITEDGRETTYRQMADEMQTQRNEADKTGLLHEVAAACAARNGF